MPNNILIDDARFMQIVINLIGNAVKFTNKGEVNVIVMWESANPLEKGTSIELLDINTHKQFGKRGSFISNEVVGTEGSISTPHDSNFLNYKFIEQDDNIIKA